MMGAGLSNMESMYGTNDIPSTLDGYFGGIAENARFLEVLAQVPFYFLPAPHYAGCFGLQPHQGLDGGGFLQAGDGTLAELELLGSLYGPPGPADGGQAARDVAEHCRRIVELMGGEIGVHGDELPFERDQPHEVEEERLPGAVVAAQPLRRAAGAGKRRHAAP